MLKKRKTKIVATIGPASMDNKVLSSLCRSGADIFRFNLKHGNREEHLRIISAARKVSKEQGRNIGILIDFPKYNSKIAYELAKETSPEHIALSYISNSDEIEFAREKLKKENIKTNIISKIETESALKNFAAILNSSEALMVARGDLGRSVKVEYVPFVQKEIIQSCRKHKKFVIVATEMLFSMTKNKLPTRAEAGDVANAVIEGADAVMLSEETAIGHNPEATVVMMDKIVTEAEYWKKNGHIRIFSSKEEKFDFGKE